MFTEFSCTPRGYNFLVVEIVGRYVGSEVVLDVESRMGVDVGANVGTNVGSEVGLDFGSGDGPACSGSQ